MNDTHFRCEMNIVSTVVITQVFASHARISVTHLMQHRAEHQYHRVFTSVAPQKKGFRVQLDSGLPTLVTTTLSINSLYHCLPFYGDITSEPSAEEDSVQVRNSLDQEVGSEAHVLFGIVDGDLKPTDYIQLLRGGNSLFVVPAHDLLRCLRGSHKGAFVEFVEHATVVEVDLALLARVAGSAFLAEMLQGVIVQFQPEIVLCR